MAENHTSVEHESRLVLLVPSPRLLLSSRLTRGVDCKAPTRFVRRLSPCFFDCFVIPRGTGYGRVVSCFRGCGCCAGRSQDHTLDSGSVSCRGENCEG